MCVVSKHAETDGHAGTTLHEDQTPAASPVNKVWDFFNVVDSSFREQGALRGRFSTILNLKSFKHEICSVQDVKDLKHVPPIQDRQCRNVTAFTAAAASVRYHTTAVHDKFRTMVLDSRNVHHSAPRVCRH
jgi:hypothetical protein